VVAPAGEASEEVRRATTAAELKRAAALLLDVAPWVLVREPFAAAPRASLTVRRARALGGQLAAQIGTERALLPLERGDAILLARAAGATDDPRALIDLLARATAAAEELKLTLDLELFAGDDPAVIAASARR
jgi:hypothetical protein